MPTTFIAVVKCSEMLARDYAKGASVLCFLCLRRQTILVWSRIGPAQGQRKTLTRVPPRFRVFRELKDVRAKIFQH